MSNPFDNNNPYSTPQATGPQVPLGPPPYSKVQGPAIALIVVGGLGVALSILALVLNMLGTGLGAAAGNQEGMQVVAQGALGIVQSLVGLAGSGVVLFGALKMKNLENYNLAMASAVVAILPVVSPCCCVGLPIGIWAIVVLNKPDVKGAFRK